jgi:NAD(P)-dependent dehydrogenase (short-subunit alcohol dehydrogenase family)
MPQDVVERVMGEMPMGRFGEPAEIAELVAFLAGERAAYITGQDIAVDGGLSLTRINLGRSRKDRD